MTNIPYSQLKDLLMGPTRWVDVRAPVEFDAGAVPGALNLPLLNDDERHQVGLTYKEKGQAAAVELGHRLVSGVVRDERTRAWIAALQPENSVIYCFRGGMRSQIVQAWMREQGVARPIVDGGYKALRRFFLSVFETELRQIRFQVVAGPTGSGKTEFLKASGRPYLDLEGLARHRGSAFGGMEGQPQPSQVSFENALAVEILKLAASPDPVLIENESRMIGRLALPEILFKIIKESPQLPLAVPFEKRVENIFNDYVIHSSLGRDGSIEKFAEFQRAVAAISRRLGGQRAREIELDLKAAQGEFESSGKLDANRIWIEKLLKWYYDPVYENSLVSRTGTH